MNGKLALATILASLTILWTSGCDRPPSPPKLPDGEKLEVLQITPDDPAELEAVKAAEVARVNYEYRLSVLEGYYVRNGNLVKIRWVRREAKNLQNAQVFRWDGIKVTFPGGQSLVDSEERLLVESVIGARNGWLSAVAKLEQLYAAKGANFKRAVIRNVQDRFDPIRTYRYFLSAEIPGPELRPVEVIPEADRLYKQALRLYRKGKGWSRTFPTTDYNDQRKALVLFRKLVAQYPRSTKIALSAFYIGEIYKEYFREYIRAVLWFQRSWEWDPFIVEPARFQAAVVYDTLREKDRAVECYRLAIDHDPWRFGNDEYSQDRIKTLTAPPKK